MKVTMPGISGKKPVAQKFPVFEKGEYIVEFAKFNIEDRTSTKQDILYTVSLTMLDGPDMNGKSVCGKTYTHFISIPTTDHEKYNDDWFDRSVMDLVCMATAAGVSFKKDVVDSAAFIGKTVKIKMGSYHPKNSDDPDELRNVINEWLPDLGGANADEAAAAAGASV